MTATTTPRTRRIRVWFGAHVLDAYQADATVADHYAELTQRRYAGLRVTIDDQTDGTATALPERRLWPLTVK